MASPSKPSVGLLVPLQAKPTQTSAVVDFLNAGYSIVTSKEPLTLQWFAVKYTNSTESTTYAVFDTSAAEAGRQAHLQGDVAAALGAHAEELFTEPPKIGHVDVLASKVTSANGGLANGLIVLIHAKPEKLENVRKFLIGALPLVEAEADTPVWYAIEFPNTNTFGIIDFFGSEEGRNTHLGGKVAEALFASVDELLTGVPDVAKVEVLAAKV